MTACPAFRNAARALAAAGLLWALQAQAETALPPVAGADTSATACEGCKLQLTPAQLFAMTERMVGDKLYDEARPLVAALKVAPGMENEARFLEGMIALETGDTKTAVSAFRAILAVEPGLTRVRLELAKALIASGDLSAADYHLKLAEHDGELPPDIAKQVRLARTIIRSQRKWQFGFDLGIAPDTNINSATNATAIDFNFYGIPLAVPLNQSAKATSGTGITASTYASLRLPLARKASLLFDFDASMVNYDGKQFDDYTVQLATGPEFRVNPTTSIAVQSVGLMRWYGGMVASGQLGGKITLQHEIGKSQRVALQLDGRHSDSDYGPGYSGWQLGLSGTYEHVVGKAALASASLFARRDLMTDPAYANKVLGLNLGLGAELPLGINAGLSGGAALARYDAPQFAFFDKDLGHANRREWRYNARVYAGLRKVRVLGFSPSVEYQFQRTDSNYVQYDNNRHRVQFKLARYF